MWKYDPNNVIFDAYWCLPWPPVEGSETVPASLEGGSSGQGGCGGSATNRSHPAHKMRRRGNDRTWRCDGRLPSQDPEPDPEPVKREIGGQATSSAQKQRRRRHDPLWRDDGRRPSQDSDPDPDAVARDGSSLFENSTKKRKRTILQPRSLAPAQGHEQVDEFIDDEDDGASSGPNKKAKKKMSGRKTLVPAAIAHSPATKATPKAGQGKKRVTTPAKGTKDGKKMLEGGK